MIEALDHVLMFVPSVRAAANWYASVLQQWASFVDENFATISVGSAKLCFHPADAKVPAGRAGQNGPHGLARAPSPGAARVAPHTRM
jgi:hypothetical protein